MKPIKFKQATKCLQKPEGMTDEECGELWVWNGDLQRCISCWQLTFWERIKLVFSGKLWVWVWMGQTQPPISIDINFPFK